MAKLSAHGVMVVRSVEVIKRPPSESTYYLALMSDGCVLSKVSIKSSSSDFSIPGTWKLVLKVKYLPHEFQAWVDRQRKSGRTVEVQPGYSFITKAV